MQNRKKFNFSFFPLVRYLLVLIVAGALISGCLPSGTSSEQDGDPPRSVSLLNVEPLIGTETEVRDPAPRPARMILRGASVEGWFLPPEAMIRLPVEIEEGARITFRIGVTTDVSIYLNNLLFRVEYIPENASFNGNTVEIDNPATSPAAISTTLFEASPASTPRVFAGCFDMWYTVDLSLAYWTPGSGELRLSAEGPLAGSPDVHLMLGQPTIYYPERMQHKNILLIGVDTLRQDSVSPYGADENITPYLGELSETATVFTQARSQAPWTLPSFASMLTGGLPSEIGATIYTGYLPDRNTTIGEMLFNKGYTTATICSNTWLGNEQSGFEQGMEELWFEYNASAGDSVEIAKDFIARSLGRDWFCFLHFFDPHVPYAPEDEYIDRLVDPGYGGRYGNAFGAIEEWKAGLVTPTDEDLNHVKNLYYGEVAEVDNEIGDLIAYLEENNLLENTLVIFAADHGEEFFDHGGFEHGHTQYDELVLMPLIVKGEGFAGGTRSDANVGNTDIFPTILEYAGIEIPPGLPGDPLQTIVTGDYPTDRIVFGEDNSRGPLRKFGVQWPYKCIVDVVNWEILLFNMEDDPGETTDISADHPDIVARLTREIVSSMLPDQTAFHVWITRGYREAPHEFSGTIHVPGGIEEVTAFRLDQGDVYNIDGDTISFTIKSSQVMLGPNKHIMIIPSDGAESMEVSVLVDGLIQNDRFFPYGSRESEPSCTAAVHIDDFPLGTSLPLAIEEYPAGCYLWGQMGYDLDDESIEMDNEMREQLRALGYLND